MIVPGRGGKPASRSTRDRENVSLDFAIDGAAPEPRGDGLRRGVGGIPQSGLVPGLDLVAQRRSLAIGNRRNARRQRLASLVTVATRARDEASVGRCRVIAATS
jgi:hypothetical protein